MTSGTTRNYRKLFWLCTVISLLLNICPLAVYVIKAACESQLIHEKVTLTMTVFVVLILTIISLVNKVTLRSRLWIVLLGVYVCLDNIMTPLILIACCQVLDEIVAQPLAKSFKARLVINKQIDRRL